MNWTILAASLTLAWDANSEPDIALYRVHVGIQSMVAGNPPLVSYPVNLDTTFEVTGLEFEIEYFFVVTAINSEGLESGYSNEVTHTILLPTPTPSPTPIPIPTPTPEATPPKWGWWKNFFNR